MKSSILFATALSLPSVFAAVLPRDAIAEPDGVKAYFEKAAAGSNPQIKRRELRPRRAGPLLRPAITTPPPGVGYLPVDPNQAAHNSIVGGHPFLGHGPAIVSAAPSSIGMYDTNLTLVLPIVGTAPPIQNATATIYAPEITDCPPQPVGEYVDSDGNFLPPELQPGYNGSISTNGTIPGNCTPVAPIPEDEVIITGHVEGNTEVVEINISPIPDNSTDYGYNSTVHSYYDAGYAPSAGVGGSSSSSTSSSAGSLGTGTRQRVPVPDAGNPGFVGPEVRR